MLPFVQAPHAGAARGVQGRPAPQQAADDCCTADRSGVRHEYGWVTDLPLNGKPDSPRINFIQFRSVSGGKMNSPPDPLPA